MTTMTITKLTTNEDNHGGARLLIDGRKVNVASIRSYGIYCGDSEEEIAQSYEKAEKLHHDKVWINLCSAVICGDRGYYDIEKAKWADAPSISVGDLIEFEGVVYKTAPTFNRNYKLIAE